MIVLNRMFVGNYCLSNIGHEIINMFQTDDERYFVYLNAVGSFSEDKRGKVEYILNVRSAKNNMVEVISKAEVVEEIYQKDKDQKEDPDIKGIRYNGTSVVDLFNANTNQQNIYVTYRVESIIEPASPLYISFDVDSSEETGNNSIIHISSVEETVNKGKSTLKQYVEDGTYAYKVLEGMIEDPSLWKDEGVEKVRYNLNSLDDGENFFEACGIQNSELAFSNAFAYIADKYKEEFCLFAQFVLGVDLSLNFKIEREYKNIDLLITDTNTVIVIENKIMSHLNGLKSDSATNEEWSQLDKYYKCVKYEDKDLKNKANFRFFVFAPDYNDIDLSKCKDEKGPIYHMIRYSTIYKFLKLAYKKNEFIKQLIVTMEPHTQPTYDFYVDMKKRFVRECKRVANKL